MPEKRLQKTRDLYETPRQALARLVLKHHGDEINARVFQLLTRPDLIDTSESEPGYGI